MESVERSGQLYQSSSPLRSLSRIAHNEKSSYRLFPSANQRTQVSPKTLQQQTLAQRGPVGKRRSVSLDDSARPNDATRSYPTRTEHASVPRIQPVPANRQRGAKAQHGQQSSEAPNVLPYKPRLTEDGGHERSSSAPGDITKNTTKEKKFTGRSNMAAAARAGLVKPLRSLGGSWYDDRLSVVPSSAEHGSTKGKSGKSQPKLEKPLPPPPPPKDSKDTTKYLDASHSRSHSTPLSPSPRSGFYIGPRSESVSELVPLVTPSSMDPNRKSYFPLSADAQMRRLMGIDEMPDVPTMPQMPATTRKEVPFKESSTQPTSLKSHQQKTLPTLPSIQLPSTTPSAGPAPNTTKKADKVAVHRVVPATQPATETSKGLAPPSPTFSQASSILKPAALRIAAPPKRSLSVSSTLDKRPLQSRLEAAKELLHAKPAARPSTASSESSATMLMTLSELSTQTDNLHARYASLREERQAVSTAITEALREHKAGPEYTNTLLDRHMSLAAICSSMDICIAKLKAVSKRRDRMMVSLVTAQAPINQNQPSYQESQSAPASAFMKPISTAPSSNTTTPINTAYSTTRSTRQSNGSVFSTQQARLLERSQSVTRSRSISRSQSLSRSVSRASSRADSDYDMSDNDVPRRINMKGAKAAKILGLVVESPEFESQPNRSYPMNDAKANLSTNSLDRELFTRGPSPAPDRPLPARPLQARPSVRKLKRDNVPAPLPLQNTTTQPAYVAHNSADTYDSSSRTSSPAEERGAETPQEEYPELDAKSPGMQTVHVYFPESTRCSSMYSSTFSEVGEDELLEYYGYLR
ncbi:hypothetical protein Q7P37_004238 [Cladosporium fusiforme]